jgi:hypothetical protein
MAPLSKPSGIRPRPGSALGTRTGGDRPEKAAGKEGGAAGRVAARRIRRPSPGDREAAGGY